MSARPCPGEAHRPGAGHVDACPVCAPHWGEISPCRLVVYLMGQVPGETLRARARYVAAHYPAEVLDALEDLGSWPSSEPALAALQAVSR